MLPLRIRCSLLVPVGHPAAIQDAPQVARGVELRVRLERAPLRLVGGSTNSGLKPAHKFVPDHWLGDTSAGQEPLLKSPKPPAIAPPVLKWPTSMRKIERQLLRPTSTGRVHDAHQLV